MGNSQSAASAPVDKSKARDEALKTLVGAVFDKVRGTSDKVTINADNFVPAILHECNQEVTLKSASNVHAPTLDVYLPFSDTENKGKGGVYDRESFVALLSNLAHQVSEARLAYVDAVWAAAEGGSGAGDKVKVEKLVASIKGADSLDVTDEARELRTAGGENYNSYVAQRVGTNAAATFAGKAEVAKEDIEAALEQPRLGEHDVVRALHGESLGFAKANIAGKAVGAVGDVGVTAYSCFTCAPDADDKYRIKEAKGPRACFNTVTFHGLETPGEKKARKEAEAKAAVEKEAKEKKEKEEAEAKKAAEAKDKKKGTGKKEGGLDARSCDFACFDPEPEAVGGAGSVSKPKASPAPQVPLTPASKRAAAFATLVTGVGHTAAHAQAAAALTESADVPADVKAYFAASSADCAAAKAAAEALKTAAAAADATDASVAAALATYNAAAKTAGIMQVVDPALHAAEGSTRADAIGISTARQIYQVAHDAAVESYQVAAGVQSKIAAAGVAGSSVDAGAVAAAKHHRDLAFQAALAAFHKHTAAADAASRVDLSAVLEAAKAAQESLKAAKEQADAAAKVLVPAPAPAAASSSSAGAGAAVAVAATA